MLRQLPVTSLKGVIRISKATEIGKSLLLVFAVTVLGQLVTQGGSVFDLGAGEWKAIAAAGIAAVLAFGFNYLNAYDPRYGVGSDS